MKEQILKERIMSGALMFVIVVTGFFLVKLVAEIKAYGLIGADIAPQTTITVTGEGEAVGIPDVAEFSFSATKEADTVAEAQGMVSDIINASIAFLKESGIAEKDIKNTGYNVYPRYEYKQQVCTPTYCPPVTGERMLVGYEVSQTIGVKIRELEKAGTIIGGLGKLEVTNISGISFMIDDEDALKREARKEAIDDAQEKAKNLARDLGVDLVRVVTFNEQGNYPVYPMYDMAVTKEAAYGLGGGSPEIPVGENKIISNVSIIYEIR